MGSYLSKSSQTESTVFTFIAESEFKLIILQSRDFLLTGPGAVVDSINYLSFLTSLESYLISQRLIDREFVTSKLFDQNLSQIKTLGDLCDFIDYFRLKQ